MYPPLKLQGLLLLKLQTKSVLLTFMRGNSHRVFQTWRKSVAWLLIRDDHMVILDSQPCVPA